MYELNDKVFVITGGAAGIGAGLVASVLEEGSKHVAVLDIDVTNGKALERELSTKHGAERIKFYKCDVTTKDLDDIFDEVHKKFGYIDCVINNAGIMSDGPAMFLKEIEINVTAPIRSSLKALNFMRKDHGGKGGTVVNISSAIALIQSPCVPIYSATKSAILQFSNCLGMEPHYTRTGVRVITICFGVTETSILQKVKYSHIDKESDDDDLIGHSITGFPCQSIEAAAKGSIEAYKRGASASTWLIYNDKQAIDITADITKGYEIMGQKMF